MVNQWPCYNEHYSSHGDLAIMWTCHRLDFAPLYPSGIQPLSPLIVITYPGPSPLDQPTPQFKLVTLHLFQSSQLLPTVEPEWVLIRSHHPFSLFPDKKQHLSMICRVTCDLALSCPLHGPHAFKPESSQPLSLRASAHPSWIFLEHSSPFSMLN